MKNAKFVNILKFVLAVLFERFILHGYEVSYIRNVPTRRKDDDFEVSRFKGFRVGRHCRKSNCARVFWEKPKEKTGMNPSERRRRRKGRTKNCGRAVSVIYHEKVECLGKHL